MSYHAVIQRKFEQPNPIPLVVAAHGIHQQQGNHFTGSSVLTAAPGLTSNLLPLTDTASSQTRLSEVTANHTRRSTSAAPAESSAHGSKPGPGNGLVS